MNINEKIQNNPNFKDEGKEPKEMLKFYADLPDGRINVMQCWKSYNYDNSMRMLGKFGGIHRYKIRAAFHNLENGKSIKIPKDLIQSAILLAITYPEQYITNHKNTQI